MILGAAAAGSLLASAATAGPAVASIAPLRRAMAPALAGIGPLQRIALTYDDGPDPRSTPAFLDLLERHDVRATFFLLGAHVAENRSLVRAMADAGHELAVHGWDHTCVLAKRPRVLREELRRAADLVSHASGEWVRWYRPPYGVLSTPALLAARAAGMTTVLWSAWGRDWERLATAPRIVRTVESALRPGGTVLLHDTDRTSAPGSWTRTLPASEMLLASWHDRGLSVGPLAGHGLGGSPGRRAMPGASSDRELLLHDLPVWEPGPKGASARSRGHRPGVTRAR